MTMDQSNPMDWVFILALVQLFGLKYMMAATDGWHYVEIPIRKRWFALVVGMTIIWVPYIILWVIKGFGPIQMWNATTVWWYFGHFIGNVFAIGGWWLLLSPIHALIAIVLIRRDEIRELRMAASPWV